MPKVEGGCLCGEIRYESEAEPLMQVVCHCRTCQKNSGSSFSTNIAVPADSLRIIRGQPKMYEDHSGASGQAFHRHFCATCGSHVYAGGPAYGELSFIKAGTLDDAAQAKPDTHIWCAEKMGWYKTPGDAKTFDANPG